jgi:hypothetical protein
MINFDPSVYGRPEHDHQEEPHLPKDQWIERFVARMKKLAEKCAAPDFSRRDGSLCARYGAYLLG